MARSTPRAFHRASSYSREFRDKSASSPGRLATGKRWWDPSILDEKGSDARASALCRDVQTICDRQQDREALQLLHYSLFGTGAQLVGFGPNSYSRMTMESTERLSLNMVQAVIAAAKSRITKTKPRASFDTMAADYELRERAEGLEKYVDGIFYQTKNYEVSAMAEQDAMIDGRGFKQWDVDMDDKLTCKRVYPFEAIWDDAEAIHPGGMKTFVVRRFWDRYELACWAKENEERFGNPCGKRAEPLFDRVMALSQSGEEARDATIKATSDLVLVYDAFRLSCRGEPEPTGRRTISTSTFCIRDVPWTWSRFPITSTCWVEKPFGLRAVGIAELLTGLQVEITTLLQQIQEGHHLVRGHYLVEAGSEVLAAHINNDLANILTYRGTEPRYQVPSIIAPEVYEHLKWLVEQCFMIPGVSQLMAQGEPTPGITSGRAVQAIADQETERFIDPGRNYENMFLDDAEVVILWSKDIAKRNPDYMINARAKRELVAIEWSKIDMERDEFAMQVFPTSMLASSPAARQQQVQDMLQAGLLDPDTALDLLDFPDTAAYSRRRSGWRRCVENDLTKIARDGEAVSPEPFYNIEGAIPLVRDALNDYRLRGLPEDRLELMREYLIALTRLPAIQQQLIPSQMVSNTMTPMPSQGTGPAAAGVGPAPGPAGPSGQLPATPTPAAAG